MDGRVIRFGKALLVMSLTRISSATSRPDFNLNLFRTDRQLMVATRHFALHYVRLPGKIRLRMFTTVNSMTFYTVARVIGSNILLDYFALCFL